MKADTIGTHLDRWKAAVEARSVWTREARKDLKYVDGETWTMDELEVFESQGRDPTNFNFIRPTIQLAAGIEAQYRSDVKYLGRGPADQEGAEAATKAQMLIRDQNSTDRQLSRAFWQAATTGVGWMEVGFDPDPYSCGILQRAVNSFDVYPDPCGKEPDMRDWVDVFRSVVTYPEALATRFPSFRDAIMGAPTFAGDGNPLSHSADYTNEFGDYPDVYQWDDMVGIPQPPVGKPREIRGVERWYRREEWTRLVKSRNGRVFEVDPADPAKIAQLSLMLVQTDATGRPFAKLIRALVPRVRVAIFLPEPGVLLNDAESPYSHGQFPLIPMWAYEDRNGVPQGLVRALRCPQRDLNARVAHLLKRSLTNQIWFEEGAFVDDDEAMTELAKSNGFVRLQPGGLQKIQRIAGVETATIEQYLLGLDQQMIQDNSGVTAELLGQQTNAKSGIAIQERQQQGQTRLYTLWDNRNWTQERMGELTLANMRDSWTHEMAVRVNETGRGVEFITLNEEDPDTGEVRNDIRQLQADCKVAQTSIKATEALQALESWTNFASQLPPDMQIIAAPYIAKMAQMPDSADFVSELEEIKNAIKGRMLGPSSQEQQAMALQAQQQAMAGGPPGMPGPAPAQMGGMVA